jgi:hypothetical protein
MNNELKLDYSAGMTLAVTGMFYLNKKTVFETNKVA